MVAFIPESSSTHEINELLLTFTTHLLLLKGPLSYLSLISHLGWKGMEVPQVLWYIVVQSTLQVNTVLSSQGKTLK